MRVLGLALVGVLFAATACNGSKAEDEDKDGDGHIAAEDCDDTDASIYPGATETCDGRDNNCDGDIDVDAQDARPFYADTDGDGFGDASATAMACEAPAGFVDDNTDCDDTDADARPGTLFYADADGDGYGLDDAPLTGCSLPSGYAIQGGDCDDTNADISPDTLRFRDADGDGYGSPTDTTPSCTVPTGYLDNNLDCDDTDADVNPDASEACSDGIDNNCDGGASECALSGTFNANAAYVVVSGETSGDYFGHSLAIADINGDGSDDLIAGAPRYDATSAGSDGRGYVFLGPATTSAVADATFSGTERGYVGYAIDAADLNGDGYDDLVFGANGIGNNQGAAYIFYGSASVTGDTPVDNADLIIDGDFTFDLFGDHVHILGDLNGDGHRDLLFGAPDDTNSTVQKGGSAYIFYGSSAGLTGSASASEADLHIYAEDSYADLGIYGSASGVGDTDGDGLDDLVVGAYDRTNSDYGAAYLFYGAASGLGGTLGTSSADANIAGAAAGDEFGHYVYGQEDLDLDLDGYTDFLVVETLGASNAGATYLFAGSSVPLSGDYSAPTQAQTTVSGATSGDAAGRSATFGDYNYDSVPDVLIGAGEHDANGVSSGAAYLFYGPLPSGSLSVSSADVIVYGDAYSEYLGDFGAATGDLNDDGGDDFAISAYGATNLTGELVVFYGAAL